MHGLELLPLYTWYDKTHVATVDVYKRLFATHVISGGQITYASSSSVTATSSNSANPAVAPTPMFKMGTFIEDVFFNMKLDSYPVFGTYILCQNIGPVIYHISGRKLALDSVSSSVENTKTSCSGHAALAGSLKVGDDKDTQLGDLFTMFKQAPSKNLQKKFAGRCFKCKQKGHSSRNCPSDDAKDDNFAQAASASLEDDDKTCP